MAELLENTKSRMGQPDRSYVLHPTRWSRSRTEHEIGNTQAVLTATSSFIEAYLRSGKLVDHRPPIRRAVS